MATQNSSHFDVVPPAARLQIQGLLAEILRSAPFRTSRQCQDMLRYIVEHSLAGSDDLLRERVIGIEVFRRAPEYDTAEDPIVRIRAADVRKRLAQYFQAQKNSIQQWKIEIPTGSYKAQFYCPEAGLPVVSAPVDQIPPNTEAAVSPGPEQTALNQGLSKEKAVWAIAVAIFLVTALMLIQHTRFAPTTPLDLFWGSVLENPRPILVCAGSNSVYVLSSKALEKYRSAHLPEGEDTPNLETRMRSGELKNLSGDDFIPVNDRFLTTGDASVISQVSSLLASHHHPYDLRFGSDVAFSDLRNSSAILIGAFNNSWTLNMSENLRFVYESGDSPEMHVQDRFDKSRSWGPKALGEKNSEDYAIVTRILDAKTGSALVIIAGLTHRGTQAAGEFITSPQLMAEFINRAPKDWSHKNLQIVLHTNVENDIPGSPTVIASYYW